MVTLADKLRELTRLFRPVSDTPELDARWLLIDILDLTDSDFLNDRAFEPDASQQQALDDAIRRRLADEPVSRILGQRDFWTLTLTVTPDVLDPRPDTECLVEAVLKTIPDREAPLMLLDLATGSGAILLALLSELPNATGIGTDISPAALAVARDNAKANSLRSRSRFTAANWFDGLGEGAFDVITANPPYIDHNSLQALPGPVAKYDPMLALDGGPDGLAAYRIITAHARTFMKPGGLLALEIGFDQAKAVCDLADKAGLSEISVLQDLGGNDRVVTAIKH